MTLRVILWTATLACTLVGPAVAEGAATTAPPASEEGWQRYVTLFLSDRVRGEFVDWFEPPPGVADAGAETYAFFANQVRGGVKVTVPHLTLLLEGQDVRTANLPDDASLAPPFGNLGPGALYFFFTDDDDTSPSATSLRQGFITLSDPPKLPGLALTGGRFEYSDGLETLPADPSLAWLKRQRLAERLVGPFNYTHVGRSFDGLRLVYDRPVFNLTGLVVRPTQGGFQVNHANREVNDVGLVGFAATLKGLGQVAPNSDTRLFYFGYEDDRYHQPAADRPVKVDNRPLAVREADRQALRVQTIGAHIVTVAAAGPGRVDALAWGAGQWGDWGEENHAAWAYAAEAGYQLPGLFGAPWLRLGVNQSSGDDDPDDGDHGTFFQILPTARIYAQFPFFNLMNAQDMFGQLMLRPHPKVLVRTDYHYLRLTERQDLWYAGGGAINDSVFGFSGTPANAHRELAQLVDLSVTVSILKSLTAYAYYGHAFGQGVVRATFDGPQADYGYLELTYKY